MVGIAMFAATVPVTVLITDTVLAASSSTYSREPSGDSSAKFGVLGTGIVLVTDFVAMLMTWTMSRPLSTAYSVEPSGETAMPSIPPSLGTGIAPWVSLPVVG